ncbi:PAS domain-containing protein [Haliangium sp.]|uniref:hybrid sensor histidine kinase/response regulator n=1 Tax=Haliangium sp. TaxID=2663208 RepID=UPI003D11EFCD
MARSTSAGRGYSVGERITDVSRESAIDGRDHLIATAAMMDDLQEVVLAVDAAGQVVHVNRVGQCLTGWSVERIGADHVSALFRPAATGSSRPPAGLDLDALLEAYQGGAVLVASGATARFSVRSMPVYGPGDERLGVVLRCRDLATGPSLLRDANQMLPLVMDNVPQFIFWKDTESVYLGCNRNFARVAGVDRPEDIVGKSDLDLAWSDDAQQYRELDQRVIRTNEPAYRTVARQRQADGKQAWIDLNVVPLRDAQGHVFGVLGTYEDITERRELEEQLRHAQKMKAVGQLAGGIAHDFNNLLTAIACHTELALHVTAMDSPAYVDLEQILHAIRHAADLTQQLLTFSRRRVVQEKLIRANDVVLGMSTMLRPLIRANAEMATLLAATARVRMDPGELEQVIVNLVVNSSNAMPDGGTLTIETRDRVIEPGEELPHGDVPPGRYVSVCVQDTGVGMDPDVRERIFEPFFTTKAPGEGTGLGLAIVYGIVLRAGGFIHVDSELGKGTRFDIVLPVAEAEDEEPVERPQAQERPRGDETILLVEDEAAVRHLAERILSDLGYEVIAASNGEEALRVAQEYGVDRIDLVLTDVVMPVMGGTEFVDRFRVIRPDVRVLFMSGYTGTAGVDRFLDSDASFLQKPFTLDGLTQRVREVLDGPAPQGSAG